MAPHETLKPSTQCSVINPAKYDTTAKLCQAQSGQDGTCAPLMSNIPSYSASSGGRHL